MQMHRDRPLKVDILVAAGGTEPALGRLNAD
jgi:hypothetical protein